MFYSELKTCTLLIRRYVLRNVYFCAFYCAKIGFMKVPTMTVRMQQAVITSGWIVVVLHYIFSTPYLHARTPAHCLFR